MEIAEDGNLSDEIDEDEFTPDYGDAEEDAVAMADDAGVEYDDQYGDDMFGDDDQYGDEPDFEVHDPDD